MVNRTVAANGLGKRLMFTYDAAGRRPRLTDPDGGPTTYVYDNNDGLTAITSPQGERTALAYDPADRRRIKFLANSARTSTIYSNTNGLNTLYHVKSNGAIIFWPTATASQKPAATSDLDLRTI